MYSCGLGRRLRIQKTVTGANLTPYKQSVLYTEVVPNFKAILDCACAPPFCTIPRNPCKKQDSNIRKFLCIFKSLKEKGECQSLLVTSINHALGKSTETHTGFIFSQQFPASGNRSSTVNGVAFKWGQYCGRGLSGEFLGSLTTLVPSVLPGSGGTSPANCRAWRAPLFSSSI